ncbi:MAG: hypothetical protein IRY96_04950 [Burkholderiales bacterium]|nr:hypothetical protein [Burkholderiales bacterium]
MTLMFVFALIGLFAAGYAHLQLAHYIAARNSVLAMHAVLAAVGLLFGYVAMNYVEGEALRWMTFAAGFGAVHVPPAIVLALKRARHEPKS